MTWTFTTPIPHIIPRISKLGIPGWCNVMVHVWIRNQPHWILAPKILRHIHYKMFPVSIQWPISVLKILNSWVISYNLLITNSSNNTHKLFKFIRYFRTELPLITWKKSSKNRSFGPLPWGRNWRCHWGSQQPGLVEWTLCFDTNASCCCWVWFGIQSGSKKALETWNSYMFHFSVSRLTKNHWLWVEKSSLLKPPHLK